MIRVKTDKDRKADWSDKTIPRNYEFGLAALAKTPPDVESSCARRKSGRRNVLKDEEEDLPATSVPYKSKANFLTVSLCFSWK